MVDKILVVEDSKTWANALASYLTRELGHVCDVAYSYAQAKELVTEGAGDYFVALLDLNLPDAPRGEIVDLMLLKSVPSIIVTGNYEEETRARMATKQIVDYVVKQNPEDVKLIKRLVNRVYNNRCIKVLVVTAASAFRRVLKRQLGNQRLQVFEAGSGEEALNILDLNPDIRLIYTDARLPDMDGFDLTQAVRRTHGLDTLAMIFFYEEMERDLFPKLLKSGANDFLPRDFTREEFLCRLNMNLDMLELIESAKESANRDYLTGMNNRRSLYAKSEEFFTRARESGSGLVAAVLDIDHFKRVNDTYGHDIGDVVIKALSTFVRKYVGPTGLTARIGGEEFCVLLLGLTRPEAEVFFEGLRRGIEELRLEEVDIRFTVSIGVTVIHRNSLDAMISAADQKLYEAKGGGRNRVCLEA